MIRRRRVFEGDGVTVTDVACRQPAGRGEVDAPAHHALVFVRRGCFVRRLGGTDHLLDPTLAYAINPGDEQRYDHPHDEGDDCTSVRFDPGVLASLWGGDPTLPAVPIPCGPRVDLEHRLVLAAARRAGVSGGRTLGANGAYGTLGAAEVHERTVALVAAALDQVDPARVASGRPATARARRALVAAARELLAADPGVPLGDLGRLLGVSPHHLSRAFHAGTGHTIARHRMRLRARAALERLAGGDERLADLAADLGFADQGHLCRVVRRETGETPAALRRALRAP